MDGFWGVVDTACPECGAVGRWWLTCGGLTVIYWIASGIFWSLHFALFHSTPGLYSVCAPWTWMYPVNVVCGEVYSMTYVCSRIVFTMCLHVVFGIAAGIVFPLLLPVVVLERTACVMWWFTDVFVEEPEEDSDEEEETSDEDTTAPFSPCTDDSFFMDQPKEVREEEEDAAEIPEPSVKKE